MRRNRKPELERSQGEGNLQVATEKLRKKTCKICLEKTNVRRMLSLHGCQHKRCVSCVRKNVQVRLHESEALPTCPHQNCKSKIRIRICKKVLKPELVKLVKLRLRESRVPARKRIYCPYPKCSYLMSKEKLLGQSKRGKGKGKGKRADKSGYRSKCIKCGGEFCVKCKVSWHYDMTCYDYKKMNPFSCAEEKQLAALAQRSAWRQCIKCKHMIEFADGCYHVICRCGYEFCYNCGAERRNNRATCSCPAWDERHIINDPDEFYSDSSYDSYSGSDFSDFSD